MVSNHRMNNSPIIKLEIKVSFVGEFVIAHNKLLLCLPFYYEWM